MELRGYQAVKHPTRQGHRQRIDGRRRVAQLHQLPGVGVDNVQPPGQSLRYVPTRANFNNITVNRQFKGSLYQVWNSIVSDQTTQLHDRFFTYPVSVVPALYVSGALS